jgi:menaquinone-dependent protoporphyrinogen oxidase
MSRILLVYASHFGQTFAIASRIAQRLRDIGNHVEVANADVGLRMLPPPDDYDAVILGSRVELSRHAREILDYIRVYRDALTRLPTGFFSVSMAAANGGADPGNHLAKTFGELEWHPTEAAAFAGALAYRRYGWLTRQVMKAISKREGRTTDTSRDHVFTDWTAVVKFADRIAHLVIASASAAL